MAEMTTVSVSADTWKRLNRAKEPGETFDDVLQRLISEGSA
ncbi:DUF7557 family protein [Halorussus pelagicus]